MRMFLPHILKRLDVLAGWMVHLFPRSAGEMLPFPRTVLLIRPGGIGDAVLLAPAISAIREEYSDAEVDLLVERRNSGVCSLIPGIRNVFLYDHPKDLFSVLFREYDLVIDTEQWHRLSAIVARLIRSRRRIGYKTNFREKVFTDAIPYRHDQYEAESFVDLLGPLNIVRQLRHEVQFLQVPFYVVAACTQKFRIQEPYIVLFPSASIPERRWSMERFTDLAARICKLRYVPVIVGGGDDVECGAIIAATRGVNLAGKTSLMETAAVIQGAKVVISVDSGILHIAVGLGIPTVSLFGPGRAKKWAPRGDNHIVINKNLPCSPCTTFGYTPKCPISARCMAEISVDEVEQAVLTLLARKNFGMCQQKP